MTPTQKKDLINKYFAITEFEYEKILQEYDKKKKTIKYNIVNTVPDGENGFTFNISKTYSKYMESLNNMLETFCNFHNVSMHNMDFEEYRKYLEMFENVICMTFSEKSLNLSKIQIIPYKSDYDDSIDYFVEAICDESVYSYMLRTLRTAHNKRLKEFDPSDSKSKSKSKSKDNTNKELMQLIKLQKNIEAKINKLEAKSQ